MLFSILFIVHSLVSVKTIKGKVIGRNTTPIKRVVANAIHRDFKDDKTVVNSYTGSLKQWSVPRIQYLSNPTILKLDKQSKDVVSLNQIKAQEILDIFDTGTLNKLLEGIRIRKDREIVKSFLKDPMSFTLLSYESTKYIQLFLDNEITSPSFKNHLRDLLVQYGNELEQELLQCPNKDRKLLHMFIKQYMDPSSVSIEQSMTINQKIGQLHTPCYQLIENFVYNNKKRSNRDVIIARYVIDTYRSSRAEALSKFMQIKFKNDQTAIYTYLNIFGYAALQEYDLYNIDQLNEWILHMDSSTIEQLKKLKNNFQNTHIYNAITSLIKDYYDSNKVAFQKAMNKLDLKDRNIILSHVQGGLWNQIISTPIFYLSDNSINYLKAYLAVKEGTSDIRRKIREILKQVN